MLAPSQHEYLWRQRRRRNCRLVSDFTARPVPVAATLTAVASTYNDDILCASVFNSKVIGGSRLLSRFRAGLRCCRRMCVTSSTKLQAHARPCRHRWRLGVVLHCRERGRGGQPLARELRRPQQGSDGGVNGCELTRMTKIRQRIPREV